MVGGAERRPYGAWMHDARARGLPLPCAWGMPLLHLVYTLARSATHAGLGAARRERRR